MSVKASCSITISIERIVESTHRFYKLQASTATEPAKPTSISTLPPSGWQDKEPAYSGGSTNSLYTVDLTVFSDGTFTYTDVMLSSSYEAAKAAYNKAQAAENTANAIKVYEIMTSSSRVLINWLDETDIKPSMITFTALCNRNNYAGGKLRIRYKNSSGSWITVKTVEDSSCTYTVNSAAREIQCSLLSSAGATLAEVSIPVSVDMSQVTQEDIFNKLTNNGAAGGLIYSNGQLYINAAYLNVGDGVNIYTDYDTMFQYRAESVVGTATSELAWKSNSGVATYGVVDSDRIRGKSLFITTTSSSDNGYVFLGNDGNYKGMIPVTIGQLYRISYYAKCASGTSTVRPWRITSNTRGAASPSQYGLGDGETVTTTWKRYERDYMPTESYLGLGFANLKRSTTVYICGIMIEAIDSTSQTTSPFVPAGNTQINGGMITTKSISADKLSVTDLCALGATIGGWQIQSGYLQSTNGNIKLYPDGRIVIGTAKLAAESNAFTIRNGLHIYTDHEELSAGTGEFKLFNLEHVTSGGHLVFAADGSTVCYLAASSKRYKDPCGEATHEDVRKLLDLPVVWFEYKDGYLKEGERFDGKPIIGLYAEDVYEAMPEAAQINADGQIEDWNHRILLPAMLKLIQDQEKRIAALEDRLNRLSSLNNTVDEQ